MAIAALSRTLTVPGPRSAPLVGPLLMKARFFDDPVGTLGPLFAQYGPIVALRAGGGIRVYSSDPRCPGSIAVFGPELLRQARTQHDRFHQHPLVGPLYARRSDRPRTAALNSFLVSLWGVEQDEHRRQRRLMMPAFHKKRIERYRDDMAAITAEELASWRPGEPIDIADAMHGLTLRIVTKTLFGEDGGPAVRGPGFDLFAAVDLLSNPLTSMLPYDLPGLPYRRFLDLVARYNAAMRALIARKRAAGGDNGDVLAMLLQSRDEESGACLSEEEVVGHVGALFAAGHETTANTLTWTFFLLSQHPHVCADLLDELEQVLGGAAPTVEQLEQLPLLDRVLKESMRIIPVVPGVFRRPAEDVELGGYLVPAHTEIFTSTYFTHHMPEIYAEPERFLPGRWEMMTPSPFEYSPFSVGPRMCIGATFALFEMKIVLAILLQRFRLELPAGARVDRQGFITLSPRGGLMMLAHRQDRQFSRGVSTVRGNVREMVTLPYDGATMRILILKEEQMQQQTRSTLDVIYENWRSYQEKLRNCIAPLTNEQLMLQPAARMWPLGQIVQHIISVRAGWFSGTLQDHDEAMNEYMLWGQRDSPARSAVELVRGLDETWAFIEARLQRWTPSDCARTFPDEWDGQVYEVSRSWVIYHVMEHDLHHGGEVSLILGMNGLRALDL